MQIDQGLSTLSGGGEMGALDESSEVDSESTGLPPDRDAQHIPGFLMVRDDQGLRHAIKIGAVQLLSDADPCCDSTVVVVAGRALVVDQPLDQILALMACQSQVPFGRSHGYERLGGRFR